MLHRLTCSQELRGDPQAIWEFFATPSNLDTITPPGLRFRILGQPGPMYQGQLIEYRISPFPLIWHRWLTEIRQVVPGSYFVDEQRFGPYRFWYHEHRFEPIPGGLRMTDTVTYEVGFGLFGEIAHALWIRRTLAGIFAFRTTVIAQRFPA
jgi:ligand-binding SRPBCC domain-containing protein